MAWFFVVYEWFFGIRQMHLTMELSVLFRLPFLLIIIYLWARARMIICNMVGVSFIYLFCCYCCFVLFCFVCAYILFNLNWNCITGVINGAWITNGWRFAILPTISDRAYIWYTFKQLQLIYIYMYTQLQQQW